MKTVEELARIYKVANQEKVNAEFSLRDLNHSFSDPLVIRTVDEKRVLGVGIKAAELALQLAAIRAHDAYVDMTLGMHNAYIKAMKGAK
jgi:hypothetical protein